MLEPGTKVKIRSTSGIYGGKSGVVQDPNEPTGWSVSPPPTLEENVIVRVWEHPDWEDWEPDETNDYYYREDELDVIPGAEATGSSDDETPSPSVLRAGEGDSGSA
jgi:hypothetical protein